jgi:hypothetical protein
MFYILLRLWKNCVHGNHTNLQLNVHTTYITIKLQHWKIISYTWIIRKFQGYGIFWMYFGWLYNFGQCALTLCFNYFIVCNLGTQMEWCGLHSPSPYEHVQFGKCQVVWTLPCQMHGLCDNSICKLPCNFNGTIAIK